MPTFARSDARRIIDSNYPATQCRITTSTTIGVRPVYDFRPRLAWRAIAKGSDSAVAIGILLAGGKIDWNAEIEAPAAVASEAIKPREIAARLREAAATATIDVQGWDRRREFRFGTLVIRCADHAEAIRKVADKYERGFRIPSSSYKLGRPSLRRPANADELLRALEEELASPLPRLTALAA
jgi:hypothetical protein